MTERVLVAFGRFMVGFFCLAVLTSIGGLGIVLAPVTLPILWVVARASRPVSRALLDLIAVLTAAEAGWGLAYVLWGEDGVATRVVPLCAAVAVGVLFPLTQRSGRRGLVA